jgi:hypothetical protein
MIKNILDHNHDFQINLQVGDIERLKKTFEEEYGKSDDEGFKEISNKLFAKLFLMVKKALAEDNFLKNSEELHKISRLITIFINQYQEVSATKFGEELKNYLKFIEFTAEMLEWAGILANHNQPKDELEIIKQYIIVYQRAKEFAGNYWNQFDLGQKKIIEKFAKDSQELIDIFEKSETGLKQKLEKLKFQIYLFFLSTKNGFNRGSFRNFFDEYKNAVTSCVSFVLSKAKADAELSNFKEAQELKAMLDEPTSSIDWEEEKAFMMMLIADMEEARQGEYIPEEVAAFDEMLKQFIE